MFKIRFQDALSSFMQNIPSKFQNSETKNSSAVANCAVTPSSPEFEFCFFSWESWKGLGCGLNQVCSGRIKIPQVRSLSPLSSFLVLGFVH